MLTVWFFGLDFHNLKQSGLEFSDKIVCGMSDFSNTIWLFGLKFHNS